MSPTNQHRARPSLLPRLFELYRATRGRASILLLIWSFYPSLDGVNLSGPNWQFGLPFYWLTYRQHFPGADYGGASNIFILACIANFASYVLLSATIQFVIQTQVHKNARILAIWMTWFALLLGSTLNGRTVDTVYTLSLLYPIATVIAVVLFVVATLVCGFKTCSIGLLSRKQSTSPQ